MGKQIFNFIFNSEIGTGATTSENFFFDWSRIPDVPYTVSFSFTSAIATLTNTAVPNVFVDLGQSNTFIVMPQNATLSQQSNYLGSLRPSGTGASQYLMSAEPDNPPLYLNGRPTNNNILISIKTNGIYQTVDITPAPVKYTLSLCLKEC